MKTKEGIEELAEESRRIKGYTNKYTTGFIEGYTQCQQDNKTERDSLKEQQEKFKKLISPKRSRWVVKALHRQNEELKEQNERLNAVSQQLNAEQEAKYLVHTKELSTLKEQVEGYKAELELTNDLLSDRMRVINAIPECKSHGNNCVPHCEDWVKNMKTLQEQVDKLAVEFNFIRLTKRTLNHYRTLRTK